MTDPFKNIQLKDWPDFFLAISGTSFVLILGALVAHQNMPGGIVNWLLFFGGTVLFGIGAKKAHYKARDINLPGNVWVSKWRCDFLANTFALGGVALVLFGVLRFIEVLP